MSRRSRKTQANPLATPTNWDELLADYDMVHAPNERAESKWFSEQPSLTAAIEVAAGATNVRGKRFDHQRRINKKAMLVALAELLANERSLATAPSFHDLLQVVERILRPIFGLGELYCYDTALRIGTFLKKEPDRIYLHAGTRKGARALDCNHRQPWLMTTDLPEPLRRRTPRELENILCIYASDFAGISRRKRHGRC